MNFKRFIISTLILVVLSTSAYAGAWVKGTAKNSSGSLEYKLWVASTYSKVKSAPLVLMLHGCTQNADQFAALSGMNELADKNNFLVVYPEQTATANPLKCWNWFDPRHQSRDTGEPSLIAAVIQDVRASYSVDGQRIYAVGVSAGGAMAVVMTVAYPEFFTGLGVVAGTEYKAAITVEGGLAAMRQGGPDPNQQGLLAFQTIQKGQVAPKKPLAVIAFQGTKDPYVNPANTDQLIAQWAQTNDYLDDGKDNDSIRIASPDETKGTVTGGYNYIRYRYKDSRGRWLMEKWIVEGMGHAWPGSLLANPFADPKGPSASTEIWRFFVETGESK